MADLIKRAQTAVRSGIPFSEACVWLKRRSKKRRIPYKRLRSPLHCQHPASLTMRQVHLEEGVVMGDIPSTSS